MNKSLVISIIILGLIIITFGTYFILNSGYQIGCASPIKVESWKHALGNLATDKSQLRLRRVTSVNNYDLFMGALEENSKSLTTWHTEGEEVFQVLAGKATIHSGKLENKKIVWYDNVEVNEGQVFIIPPKLLFQIESGKDDPFVFTLFAPTAHFKEDRYYNEDYNPENSACKAEPETAMP